MNISKVWVVLAAITGLALTGCAPTRLAQEAMPGAAPTDVPTRVPTAAPTLIPTEVPTATPNNETALSPDVKNATYVIEGESITLINGIAETPLVPGSASKQTTEYFGNQVDVDLNSDGLIDSAFILEQDSGGSGAFLYIVVALQTVDGYSGTNAIFLGDRIAPQGTSIDPNNPTQFVVSYADRSTDEPMSSPPTQMVSKIFKIEGDSLVEVVAPSTPIP